MKKDYYLGLKISNGSVGWAVTDSSYEILRAHGKSMWGVRLFDPANTAQDRRTARTNRRRLDRRNWRLDLLNGIFSDEINKVDDGFFLRLKESRYMPEDKRDKNGNTPVLPYALFVDKDYTDKDYHKQFPTIYHLRNYLMKTDETPDIRLVYLGIHHILKHRGHFLFTGDFNIEKIKESKETVAALFQTLKDEELDFAISPSDEQYEFIESVLKDQKSSLTDKKKALTKELNAISKFEKAVMALISGGSVKLSDIFNRPELDDIDKPKISFSDSGYELNEELWRNEIGEQFIIIEHAKAVYDWSILVDLLGSHNYLSEAKIESYEKHKADLLLLKSLVKDNLDKKAYKDLFVYSRKEANNYCAYIGMTKINGKKASLEGKRCSKDDFYAYLKKNIVEPLKSTGADTSFIEDEIQNGTFLPLQVTKDNIVIPHQVHLLELKEIIRNLKDRIPLLKEYEDKLVSLLTFRIPYYVGPLNGVVRNDKTTNWAVRNSNEQIYPWNFEEVIDLETTAEQFIKRMTGKCTYLKEEDVLPNFSLLYCKFKVLNELNNVCINGIPIDVSLKQKIYTDLFEHKRKVTRKALIDYLKREGIVAKDARVDISGIGEEFNNKLTSYHDFKKILTNTTLSQADLEVIVHNITLFGDDKKLLKQRLSKLFPTLTDKEMKGICNLSYKGWGRLSKELLEDVHSPAPETGEVWSIMRFLWETNENLMQLLSSKYMFQEAIEKWNGVQEERSISYELVDELYVSPSTKRQIWQALLIVKEICEVMDHFPNRIFIEVYDGNSTINRNNSRKKKLQYIYDKCKDDLRELNDELASKEEYDLRSDKLYLYFMQQGRCMYTGERIDLYALLSGNSPYDIDHIYPRSLTNDDSLVNKVLVHKKSNEAKSDDYPLSPEVQNKMNVFWKYLYEHGFMEKEKYERLIRKTELSADELSGYINKQLYETRQGAKAVSSILRQVLPLSVVIPVKSKAVSQFRQDFDLIKVPEMNALYSAKDAYLNIVVGNGYYTKFTLDSAWYIKNKSKRSYNLYKMFTGDRDIERNGYTAWKAGSDGTICTVRKFMNKNNILVTRRTWEATGELFDQQLMKKGHGQVPIKSSDDRLAGPDGITKYGGYNKASSAYFMLLSSTDDKGRKQRTIEYVPLHMAGKFEQDPEFALRYFERKRGLKNPRILLSKIKMDTLFNVDGFLMNISGRNSDTSLIFKNANELLLPKQEEEILKKVMKFTRRLAENKNTLIVKSDNLTNEDLLHLYDVFISKLTDTKYSLRLNAPAKTVEENRSVFMTLSLEDKCSALSEILHLFQCNSTAANLSLIGGPKSSGRLFLNNDVLKADNISIIYQSPTGIYEKEINLKKI